MTCSAVPLLLLLAAPKPAPAAKLAVLDVVPRVGISPELAQSVSDALLEEVRQHNPGMQIIGSEDIRAMLGLVRQKQQLGCQDQVGCLTELGGALGASKMVAGTLGKFGDTYFFSVRLIDVVHAKVLTSASERLPDKNDARLLDAVSRIVAHLFADPSAPPAPPSSATSARAAPPPARNAAPAESLEETPAEPASHSHLLALSLGGVALAGLVVGIVGLANVISFESYASQSHAGQTDVQSHVSAANTWANLGIAGAVVLVGGATGAVLTW